MPRPRQALAKKGGAKTCISPSRSFSTRGGVRSRNWEAILAGSQGVKDWDILGHQDLLPVLPVVMHTVQWPKGNGLAMILI